MLLQFMLVIPSLFKLYLLEESYVEQGGEVGLFCDKLHLFIAILSHLIVYFIIPNLCI